MDSETFFQGDLGIIENELRDLIRRRDAVDDKKDKQILTMQIREVRKRLLHSIPPPSTAPVQIFVPAQDEDSLFDGEVGRIEQCLRDAMKRKKGAFSSDMNHSVTNEINALVDLLKSPLLHADASISIDTKRIWTMIRNQELERICALDKSIARSLRDPATGQSLLHKASLFNNPAMIDVLVTEKLCDINAMCYEGQTPLHYAVQVENVSSARRLMELGANTNIKDIKGRTPFTTCPQYIKKQLLKQSEQPELDGEFEELDPKQITYKDIIGEGSTATVYSGLYRNGQVAIKDFDMTANHSEFNREIKILKNLSHPNLVLFVGSTTGDKMRLVTELCLGGSLYTLIHEQSKVTLSPEQVLSVCRGTLEGLAYLHSHVPQIIHLDLKSRNLLLATPVISSECVVHVKIADFGISRIASSTTVRPNSVQGTWWWMSPETLFGDFDEISDRSDIYSFAICMFEVCSRELPYESVQGLELLPPVAVAIRIANGLRPDLSRVKPEYSKGIPSAVKLIEKCWSYEPADRPSAHELLDQLNS